MRSAHGTLPPLQARALAASLACVLAAAGLCAARPAAAATSTFGSPLTAPATLNTADNLNYSGSNVAAGPSVFHIAHDGADTALWNVSLPAGAAAAPSGGQVTSIALKGCAQRPEGAPSPLTQIHFQDLQPLPGGGAQIVLTSQAFDVPVCGVGGADGNTVSTYAPNHLCVSQGDYVAFNDEGGFVPSETGLPPYPAGVPYMFIASTRGATMDSFLRNGGTNNGTSMSPADRTYHDGFAENPNEELLLQSTLATGEDASDGCPGGTKSDYKGPTSGYSQKPMPPLRLSKQTDGINHRGIASVAIYCHAAAGCAGTAVLAPTLKARHVHSVRASFSVPGAKTSHFPVRVPSALLKLARKHRSGVPMKLSVVIAGQTFTQTIVLKIF